MTNSTTLVFLLDGESLTHGFLCAKYSYSHHSEPKMIHLYWPLCERSARQQIAEVFPEIDAIESPVLSERHNGKYSLYRGYGSHIPLTITGPNPGQTKAIKIDETPIICPKVRKGIETRFNPSRGYWEKYTKSSGWIPA